MNITVLVVGAGPVGLTMAAELARYGVTVRVVDKAASRTDRSKALVLWSRTLELLDRCPDADGGPGSAPFVHAGFRVVAANIVAGDRRVGRIDLSTVDSPYPFALMLPQSETERLLDERLGRLGVTVERAVELTAFADRGDRVEALLRHADGRDEPVTADWLVACDGTHSTVRHGLAVPFAGETLDSDWILADVHLTGYPVPDTEMSIYWQRDGACVIFPISPGRYRVLADMPGTGDERPPTPTLAQAQAVIDRRGPGGVTAFDPIWLAGFRINGRKVAGYRHGRAFLAGDAAHVHSPAGGQGMNTGMQDAFNLAWKLAMVVNRTAGDQLLDSYSPERSAVGDDVLKAAGRLTAVATMRNPLARAVRNAVGHLLLGLRPVRRAFADAMTEVTIGYPDGPLNGPSAAGLSPAAGERLAPVTGQPPAGSGPAPRFALFAARTAAIAALLDEYTDLVAPDVRPPPRGNGVWLVRPDGYVAAVVNAGDVHELDRYLAALGAGGTHRRPSVKDLVGDGKLIAAGGLEKNL
ncbi:MAG: monooxygenase [Phycisphaerales bacterium]|nr:monooxygenase [Phycisphaerales bacterium]